MGIFEGVLTLGIMLGNLTSSYVFYALGYPTVCGITSICFALARWFTIFWIPESVKNRETEIVTMEGPHENYMENLLIELECPICTDYMSPPIRQCSTGHSVCENCRRRLSKCALCQGQFTESRNLSLEGLAVKMRYPCINRSAGCLAVLSYNEREIHEMRCDKKGFKCPVPNCRWIGRPEDIADHWDQKKNSSKPYRENNVCHAKPQNESFYVNLVRAHNQLFWFKCKIFKDKIAWAVQFIGKSAEAEKYCFEIKISKPGRSKRKLLVGNYCQPIDVEDHQIFQKGNCGAYISMDMLKDFMTNDELLIYGFSVSRAQDQPEQENAAGGSNQRAERGPSSASGAKKFDKKPNNQRARSRGPQNRGPQQRFATNNDPRKDQDGFIFV